MILWPNNRKKADCPHNDRKLRKTGLESEKKYSLVSFVFELDFGEMFILISNDPCNDANKRTLSVGLNIYMVTLYNTIK